MIELESYLLRPNVKITDLTDAINNPNKYFINIQNSKEVEKIVKEVDLNYVNGVICIKYNYNSIIDFSHWDLVDQLWSYIVDLVEQFESQGDAETYFPDQPIKLEFRRINSKLMLVSLNELKHTVETSVFIERLLDSAMLFFTSMHQYFDVKIYTSQLQKIELLRNK